MRDSAWNYKEGIQTKLWAGHNLLSECTMMKAHLKIAIILFARVAKFIDRLLFLKIYLRETFLMVTLN